VIVGARSENLLLALCALAVLAFIGSFIAGLGTDADDRTAAAVPATRADPAAPPAPPMTAGARVRVEVLNAAGQAGLARLATGTLRDHGFDVVHYGNASAADSSIVLHRAGNPGAAHAVARAIGVRRVESRPDTTLYLDVSVILGSDWQPPTPPAEGIGAQAERAWRGILRRDR
jgi:hypothetical protein